MNAPQNPQQLAVRLAAQADLLVLTIDMLRPPRRIAEPFVASTVSKDAGSRETRHDRLERPEWTQLQTAELSGLLGLAGLPLATASEGTTLAAGLEEAIRLGREEPLEAWADEYWRLFDSGIACPVHEASYVRRDKGSILGDLAGFYRAFGWHLDPARGDRPDHLVCELEFVAVLLAMAARAESEEQHAVVHDALAQFARLHLHDWLPSFCWQLCETTHRPLLGAVGTWLVMLWDGLTAVHDWPADRSAGTRLEPAAEGENPYECAAGGLVQLGDH